MFRLAFIAALTLSVVVACGDGKSKKRQPIRRDKAGQQGKDKTKPLTPEQQKKADEEARKKAEADEKARQERRNKMTPDERAAEDAQEKRQKEQTTKDRKALDDVRKQIDELATGDQMALNELKPGTYQLFEIVSFAQYMNKGTHVNAIRSSDVEATENGFRLNDPKEGGSTLVTEGPISDFTARKIEVPGVIEIKASGFEAGRSSFKNFGLYSTNVTQALPSQTATVIVGVQELGKTIATSPTPVSIADLMSGQQVITGAKSKVFTMAEGKKQITMHIQQTADQKDIAVVVNIDELMGEPSISRTLVFIYGIPQTDGTN